MADALISTAVGGTMFATTAGIATYSVKVIQKDFDDKKVPLMGVMGAFVFTAQMINFTIPGTGSSGHIGGGLLLAAILGPQAGFLTIASILLIQALFFADGGLLAWGCNVFNMGFFTCFLAYPLIYKKIMAKGYSTKRIVIASIIASVVGLQLGAFSVVIETLLSGKTELPFGTFILLMQPIHLAIGFVEGVITAAIVSFVWKARPEIFERIENGQSLSGISTKRVVSIFLIAVVLVGGALSGFASSNPDGLEWSMIKTAGVEELKTSSSLHEGISAIQEKIAFLPDYDFKSSDEEVVSDSSWPAVNAGTSVSGIVGAIMTLALATGIGGIIFIIKRRKTKQKIV
jgi:cobalt/nickel transport system permease protein